MEQTGPEHIEASPTEPKKDTVPLAVRAPVFLYVANALAPVYQQELDGLRRDGSFEKIKNFYEGPFGTLMSQILDKQTAQMQNEMPKVELEVTDEQMREMKDKMKTPFDAAGRMLHSQMVGEITDQYRSAKFNKRARNAASKVKSFFKKK